MKKLWRAFLRRIGGKRIKLRPSRFVAGHEIGGGLCEALGLGTLLVQRLQIDVPVDGAVTITATVVGTEDQMTELRRFLLEYRAVPVPEPDTR